MNWHMHQTYPSVVHRPWTQTSRVHWLGTTSPDICWHCPLPERGSIEWYFTTNALRLLILGNVFHPVANQNSLQESKGSARRVEGRSLVRPKSSEILMHSTLHPLDKGGLIVHRLAPFSHTNAGAFNGRPPPHLFLLFSFPQQDNIYAGTFSIVAPLSEFKNEPQRYYGPVARLEGRIGLRLSLLRPSSSKMASSRVQDSTAGQRHAGTGCPNSSTFLAIWTFDLSGQIPG